MEFPEFELLQFLRAACESQGWEWFASESIIGFPRVSGDTLAERLAAAEVVACPGEFFGMPGHLRLGWVLPGRSWKRRC